MAPSVSTIEPGAGIATLINVFTVAPELQQRLVDLLVEATDEVISHRPGFVSANIHASQDGTRIVNYAQWRSVAGILAPPGELVMVGRAKSPRPGNVDPRRSLCMRAVYQGAVLAESDNTVVVEGNHYFPADSVQWDLFEPSNTHSTCPWKGEASYYSTKVGDKVGTDVAWTYPDPKRAASNITGHVAFWNGVRVEES